jgi:large subunit ribosomal protein L6
MRKELSQIIEIPEGVTLTLDNDTITVKGNEGEISRAFNFGRVDVSVEGNVLTLGNKFSTKTEKKMMNTITAHVKNMIAGVQEKFVYELKVCSGHFPMSLKQEGNKIIVKNFLGEKIDRVVTIMDGADVEINKEMITVKSINKEIAGQTAANFEKATIIKGRDKRIFQDGVYIIKKCGKEI